MNFGEQIKKLRKDRNMTQQDMAWYLEAGCLKLGE